MKPAVLALEDGTIFGGQSFGAPVSRTGEVVFNTSITGYQEIFTDPSYAGQIVALTYPQIGNYGANAADAESAKPHIEGLAVRDFSPLASNWRSEEAADQYLADAGVPIISGMDVRSLVLHLRSHGAMRGALVTGEEAEQDKDALVGKARNAPSMAGQDLATKVSTAEQYHWNQHISGVSSSEHFGEPAPPKFNVVAYDFGIKRNILRRLVQTGCKVTVVPATTPAEDVLAMKPDGVFLSNGPGDPEPLTFQAQQIAKIVGKAPVFGICLGHQVLALALGGKTYKLKFGHRGGNHPVLNQTTGKVEITAHNHGFAVDADSLNTSEVDLTHVNLNDQTLEGFRHRHYPVFSVQYHPEAAPGPHDSLYLFDDFVKLMEDNK